jgi:hypothetical protein
MRRSNSGGILHRLISGIGLALGAVRGIPLGAREAIEEATAEPRDPSTRFEAGDLHPKAVFLTGVGVLVGTWVIVMLVYPLFVYLKNERSGGPPPPAAARQGNPVPPEPRIQANPKKDLHDFRVWEESQLNSYQWVDRAHQVVSIPIDQAIKIVARRGIPPQPAPAGQVYFDPRAGTRVTGFEGKVEPEPR